MKGPFVSTRESNNKEKTASRMMMEMPSRSVIKRREVTALILEAFLENIEEVRNNQSLTPPVQTLINRVSEILEAAYPEYNEFLDTVMKNAQEMLVAAAQMRPLIIDKVEKPSWMNNLKTSTSKSET